MECKNTSIRLGKREAFTLVELMVVSALGLVLLTAVATFSFFSSRSFVTMRITDMNQQSQYALDKMIRKSGRCANCRPTPPTALRSRMPMAIPSSSRTTQTRGNYRE
jgi:prepilin-type N-terminal cleavage/methylation domain-containing protein